MQASVATSPATFGNLTLDRADLAQDEAEVTAIWNQNFVSVADRYHTYLNNPRGPGTIWVLRNETGGVVGAAGLHARGLSIHGRIVEIGQIGNMAVDHNLRTAGPALRLTRELLESLPGSQRGLILGATAKISPILRRLGCHTLGSEQRWSKPLRVGNKLSCYVKSASVARFASPLVDAALKWGTRERFYYRTADVSVEVSRKFDERFDRFWKRAAQNFEILSERSADYLNWRFAQDSGIEHQNFTLVDASRELRGYIVFHGEQDRIEIDDILYENDRSLSLLLLEFLKHVRYAESDATTVSLGYLGGDALGQQLFGYGFRKRPINKQVFVSMNPRVLGVAAASMIHPKRWFLTGADMDL